MGRRDDGLLIVDNGMWGNGRNDSGWMILRNFLFRKMGREKSAIQLIANTLLSGFCRSNIRHLIIN